MSKRALIFGAGGQAGGYLTTFLQRKDYQVVCVGPHCEQIVQFDSPRRPPVDVRNYDVVRDLILDIEPDEIYNLASVMYAPASWSSPVEYMEVNGLAVVAMLDAAGYVKKPKFFQAGSAEVFERGHPHQNELTPRRPSNPYGLSKLVAEEAVRIYREKGLFACTGILFNMESPFRPRTFFAQKVAAEAVRIRLELDAGREPTPMQLGRLTAVRDWGLTEEYVEAMWLMLQAVQPDDYVIGTGRSTNCYRFVQEALAVAGLPTPESDKYVRCEPQEAGLQVGSDRMQADPTKIHSLLGWHARSAWPDVVRVLVEAEQKRQQQQEVQYAKS